MYQWWKKKMDTKNLKYRRIMIMTGTKYPGSQEQKISIEHHMWLRKLRISIGHLTLLDKIDTKDLTSLKKRTGTGDPQ